MDRLPGRLTPAVTVLGLTIAALARRHRKGNLAPPLAVWLLLGWLWHRAR